MTWTYEPIEQTWPQLTRDTDPATGKRLYRLPTGEAYPSVTTVLHATEGPERQQALDAWRRRVGKDVAAYITKRAQDTGTDGHAHMEHLLQHPNQLGTIATRGVSFDVQGHVRNLTAFAISKIKRVVATELYLYSSELKIAGACDGLVVDMSENLAIVDWKCMSHAKNFQPDYLVQACLYALLAEERTDMFVPTFYVAASAADTGALIVRECRTEDFAAKARARVKKYYDNPLNRPGYKMVLP